MKTPPLLLGLALVFWGYQTGMLWVGCAMAGVVELSLLIRQRWEVDRSDYYRVWDFCAILFAASAIYSFVSRDTTNDLMEFFQATNYSKRNQVMNNAFATAFIFFQWMPIVFFPIVLTQSYGSNPQVPYSTFSWIWRRQLKRGAPERGTLNVSYPYFAMILFSTSLVNERDPVFFMGLSILVLFALAAIRPRRFSPLVWAPLALLVVTLGYSGHIGLQRVQGAVETSFSEWLSKVLNRRSNPYESRTAIGRLGRLKLSGEVVMRVEVQGAPVELLREASYDVFASPSWTTIRVKFEDAVSENDASTWPLMPEKKVTGTAIISTYFPRGRGMLSAPNGVAVIDKLVAAQMETNFYGGIRVSNATAFARYEAKHGPGMTIDSEPTETDTQVVDNEAKAIKEIIRETGLKRDDPLPKKLQTLQQFFVDKFRYDTWQGAQHRRARETMLSYFLLRSRSGHCEYFATATVLLLRELDVPARYAVGFAVQETEGAPNRFVVRERHGHAWVLYYDKAEKVWKDFDTTPPDWMPIEEAKNASMFEPIKDLWSKFRFQLSEWRWLTDREKLRNNMIWVMVVLISFLGWRLVRRSRIKRTDGGVATGKAVDWPGIDSEFYAVEQKLAAMGLDRFEGESVGQWLKRVGELKPEIVKELPPLVQLHYRYRFDPEGLSAEERQTLKEGVAGWMAAQQ
ncbi:MAG: transglutaminase-like enzyme, predicted cysteine protease, partial [Verrucomicrobia bacterium]|nr:transglutaminase-like enzyme, predicted cysteine protease [Verrucomicrobiota bacterium]